MLVFREVSDTSPIGYSEAVRGAAEEMSHRMTRCISSRWRNRGAR